MPHPKELTDFVLSQYGVASAREVANEVNAMHLTSTMVTRNAVVGMWNRAIERGQMNRRSRWDFPHLPQPIPRRDEPPRLHAVSSIVLDPRPRPSAEALARAAAREAERVKRLRDQRMGRAAIIDKLWPKPTSKRLKIGQLKRPDVPYQCRWISDDGTYCGHRTSKWGSSYCDHHAAIVHDQWPPVPRGRSTKPAAFKLQGWTR